MPAKFTKTYPVKQPKYQCKEEIEGKIEQYFKDCEGHILVDKNGNPIRDKYGYPVIVDRHPPTITGLGLALGFASRQSLLNYQGKKEFCEVITRAKSRIEAYVEERLFDKDGANGAKFSLQNNFRGWNEATKEAAEAAASAVKIISDIPKAAEKPEQEEESVSADADTK